MSKQQSLNDWLSVEYQFGASFKGPYHWMSLKHLQRYVNECCGRLNLRGLGTLGQLAEIVRDMDGKRLTLRELVA